MICRHGPNDRDCSKNGGGYAAEMSSTYEREAKDAKAEAARLKNSLAQFQKMTGYTDPPATPDAFNFEIVRFEEVCGALVVQIKYPNCNKCSYEGLKTLVYESTSVGDALLWREIDPHFQDTKKTRTRKQAPGPSARFPGSDLGWDDALAYAQTVLGVRQERRLSNTVPLCGESNWGDKPEFNCMRPKGHSGRHQNKRGDVW